MLEFDVAGGVCGRGCEEDCLLCRELDPVWQTAELKLLLVLEPPATMEGLLEPLRKQSLKEESLLLFRVLLQRYLSRVLQWASKFKDACTSILLPIYYGKQN